MEMKSKERKGDEMGEEIVKIDMTRHDKIRQNRIRQDKKNWIR